jgi:hypothetical protein
VIFVFSFVPKFGDRKLSSPNPDPGHRKQVITQRQRIEGKPAYEYNGIKNDEQESKYSLEQGKKEEEHNIQNNNISQSHIRNEQNQQFDLFHESLQVLLIFNILETSAFNEQLASKWTEYGVKDPKSLRNKIAHSYEKGRERYSLSSKCLHFQH